ncbi:E3 ubiquitin-protein ligase RLIM-like [Papaver somniferum]|uniref:E3 ubiquitin-protein ligase RLIM-like n=1 Tax=Papaver somniferum TaxID=3469 RepID=UPI000E6F84AA|nr:E3 ubiquitin-protein ligase RLIM-like [Papaver somniferum]
MSSSVVKDKNLMIQQEEQIRYNSRRPRNQSISPSSSSSADPTPQISPLLQSTRCKPTISSIFLSTFINNNNSNGTSSSSSSNNMKDNRDNAKKKKNLSSSSSFKGFGCASTSSHQVSAPTVIRTSADWQAKKVGKKKQRKKQPNPTPLVVVPDVWCAPGIAFSAADTDASVDCVVSRRPLHQSSRGRNDNNGGGGDRVSNNNHNTHRERPCISRRTATLEQISSILDSPSDLEPSHIESKVFGARHHRHYRHGSPGGISEILMFQNSLLLEGRSSGHDRYRDLRLDVDNMTYEELLDLGESIGNVSTGLREDEITRCLRKTKHSILDALQSRFLTDMNWKCSICQEEYEADDEVGKLNCGHNYHICCIKQWLLQKNACPVCKVPVTAQY